MKNYKNPNKKQLNLVKDFQACKFFLTLHFCDFAFEWQLIKQHNLTKSQIQKYSELLNERGFISFKLLSELSENMQEAILKIIPDFAKVYGNNPKVYIITPEGKKEGKKIVEDILRNNSSNQGLYFLIMQLAEFSKNFREVKKKILYEENNLLEREVIFPNGIKIIKNTNKKIGLLSEIKQFKRDQVEELSSSKGNLPISTGNKQDLTIAQEIKQELNKNIEYDGIYSHLTNHEIEKLSNGVTLSEEKQIEKEYKKEISETLKQQYSTQSVDYEVLRYQGKTLTKEQKEKIFDEGMDFLNSLG